MPNIQPGGAASVTHVTARWNIVWASGGLLRTLWHLPDLLLILARYDRPPIFSASVRPLRVGNMARILIADDRQIVRTMLSQIIRCGGSATQPITLLGSSVHECHATVDLHLLLGPAPPALTLPSVATLPNRAASFSKSSRRRIESAKRPRSREFGGRGASPAGPPRWCKKPGKPSDHACRGKRRSPLRKLSCAVDAECRRRISRARSLRKAQRSTDHRLLPQLDDRQRNLLMATAKRWLGAGEPHRWLSDVGSAPAQWALHCGRPAAAC